MDIYAFKKLHQAVPSWLEYDGRNVRAILDRYAHLVDRRITVIGKVKRVAWAAGASVLGLRLLSVPDLASLGSVGFWASSAGAAIAVALVTRSVLRSTGVLDYVFDVTLENADWDIVSNVLSIVVYHAEATRIDWSQGPFCIAGRSTAYLRGLAKDIVKTERSGDDFSKGLLTFSRLQFDSHYRILKSLGLVDLKKARLFE